MSDYFDRFKNRMEDSGKDLRGAYIKNSVQNLKTVFKDDTSYETGIYCWKHDNGKEDYENEKTIDIRMFGYKFSSANGKTVSFITQKDTPVYVGDIFYDKKLDVYWLCTDSYMKANINYEGTLTMCTWILKWQNESGVIFNYPCFVTNATQYNSGEQQKKQIIVGSAQYHIKLPYDENTIILKSPKRFYIDRDLVNPVTYQVTDNDSVTYAVGDRGIIKLTVEECEENNETDRPDLGLCDYIEIEDTQDGTQNTEQNVPDNTQVNNDDNTNNTQENGNDDIVGVDVVINYKSNKIKSGGKAQTFEGAFYNNNELLDLVGEWEIISNFTNKMNVAINGNKITIKVDNDDLIDEEFKLIFKDESGENKTSIIVKIISLI